MPALEQLQDHHFQQQQQIAPQNPQQHPKKQTQEVNQGKKEKEQTHKVQNRQTEHPKEEQQRPKPNAKQEQKDQTQEQQKEKDGDNKQQRQTQTIKRQQQQQEQSQQPIQKENENEKEKPFLIRHAGRVSVRGKIRRIWRPRYLELWDNGWVRYYELPSTADVALPEDSDWDHVHMIPKCILRIFHARIIDVTTLRDLHIGLPRGTFGFCFHAQREDYTHSGGGVVTPSRGSGDDLLSRAAGLAGGGANMHCQEQMSQPRDYLCAVSTLEEAQMWVVALKWAASVGKLHSKSDPFWHDWYHQPVVTTPRRQQQFRSKHAFFDSNDAFESTTAQAATKAIPVTNKEPLSKQNKKSKTTLKGTSGRILVTKICHVSVVRVDNCNWELAFLVQYLLIQNKNVQECRLLRTCQDIITFQQQLQRELASSSDSSPLYLASSARVKKNLDKYIQMLQNISFPIHHSINTVNSMFQTFCMEPSAVNSQAMKQFLGLGKEPNSTKLSTGLFKIHDPMALFSRNALSSLEDDNPRASRRTDYFVKQWLQKQEQSIPGIIIVPPSTASSTVNPARRLGWCILMYAIQSPAMALSAGCLSMILFGAVVFFAPTIRRLLSVSIQVRIDVLIFSWFIAILLGRIFSPSSNSNKSTQQLSPSSTMARPTPTEHKKQHSKSAEDRQTEIEPKRKPPGFEKRVDTATSISNKNIQQNSSDKFTECVDDEDDDAGASSSSNSVDSTPSCTSTDMHSSKKQAEEEDLKSPLPEYNPNDDSIQNSCWSRPKDTIFNVRGDNYFKDKVKIPSADSPLRCRGVELWLTDNPQRNIACHPSVLGGKLEQEDTFLVNFLLPFGNFVAYFAIPDISKFPPKLRNVWTCFLNGDQQYRDARLKLLPVVVEGPWIVKAAVGPGTSPALLGKVIPLQYFFRHPSSSKADTGVDNANSTGKGGGQVKDGQSDKNKNNNSNNKKDKNSNTTKISSTSSKGIYEVDVIITASTIAKGILSVVKGHTKNLTIAFALIIEAAEQAELPETVLCSFQVHSLHLEHCLHLPDYNLDYRDTDAPEDDWHR